MQKRKHLFFTAYLIALLFLSISQAFGQLACLPTWQYQDSPYWRGNVVFTGLVDKFVADNKPAA
ncbi:MAG: hypothetical protein ABJB40_06965, partial [Acidobacteriota bacterium]